MTLADFDDDVACSRQGFEEGLISADFTELDAGWRGTIDHRGGAAEVVITLDSGYPFQPPRVVPLDPNAVAWSWHRNLDGSLCLIAEDDHEGLWWTKASAFLEHVTAWFEQATAGWPDDRPDLDLDRYFQLSADERLYLYDDLTRYPSGFVRFRPAANNTMRIGGGTRPAKSLKHSKDRFGYVANLGDVDVPLRTWDDVSARINPSIDLDRRIRNHEIEIVVLIYRRGSHDGAVALEVWPTVDGGTAIRRLRSGADTDAARTARSGLLAPELHGRRVAIVGIGALGSFIADMLVRSGVGQLTLLDGDIVMPGNLVRHLVGPEAVGLSKGAAVKQHLTSRNRISSADITVIDEELMSRDAAVELLGNHDLVVNATADFSTTALLHAVAQALSKRIVSAAIQNGGTSYRIDVLPSFDGADPLPSSSVAVGQPEPELFEAGCGSPISPTPPYVVIEAAAATVRHAIGLLVDRPVHPGGEVRNLSIGAVRNRQ
ncbi:UBA/THIF-type NAD/FAD binding protein [Acidipropionibacterium acidipropionici ATCC 4875]|uniref:UBA/THIF-type NAD/FAD binding protein n=1 Tax=Acidipropionibacterium acidipropionici (strain ATCC 4875 / DSM 20272 / JCM 6432 / NBRC 12425 / NCIMB 8070 / 4) TaxID=1171373 RepID=K7RXH0_ACIA4|nr:ThiF family adenylyltransferase [Acidipropionibacterium acidipropionici]AFV89683.1 UBA/THIF-type NAD/FAD binding protein [Acidipropionibacterium acidipropionici ATCC 4875]